MNQNTKEHTEPTNSEGLLACPFCGCTRIEVSANKKDDRDGHVWCDNDDCEAEMRGSTRQEAIERWNRRQSLATQPQPSSGLLPDDMFENEGRLIEILTGSAALAKACQDNPFDYAMKLRTGEVIAFSGANVLNREWVRLDLKPMCDQPEENRIAYPADRGMDVRLSDIVWVMDAPEGS